MNSLELSWIILSDINGGPERDSLLLKGKDIPHVKAFLQDRNPSPSFKAMILDQQEEPCFFSAVK